MTVQQTRPVTARRLLEALLTELLDTTDRSNSLDAALIATVECAALTAAAAEQAVRPDADGDAVDLARQALAALRASVLTSTVCVRELADRQRTRATGHPSASLSREGGT